MVDSLRGGIGSWWQEIVAARRAEVEKGRQELAEAARKRQETLTQEQLYAERIPHIEVFSGSLEEYESLKGGQRFQIVDVPGRWKLIAGHPYKPWQELYKVNSSHGHTYNEMLARAVDLQATAVIHWKDISSGWQQGVPIRPIADPGQA